MLDAFLFSPPSFFFSHSDDVLLAIISGKWLSVVCYECRAQESKIMNSFNRKTLNLFIHDKEFDLVYYATSTDIEWYAKK